MSNKRPEPTQNGTKWEVDLRRWKLGRHHPLGPVSSMSPEQARERAWQKLVDLLEERASGPAQATIDFDSPPADAPETFGEAIQLWKPTHMENARQESEGGADYAETYDDLVTKEFGSTRLAAICAPGGEKLIQTYAKKLRDGTFNGRVYSGKSIANRMSAIRQAIAWCQADERRWLSYMPQLPKTPKKAAIIYRWIGEEDFRALRARLYQDMKPGQLAGTLRYAGIATPADLYVEQRRMYLSWLFYTGHRTHDADAWTADDVGTDSGTYVRWSRKTGAARERYEMPGPLVQDVRAYLRFVGREQLRAGELIGGGPWRSCSTMMQVAARHLGIGSVNPRVLRRSFARMMLLLRYSETDVAARLGHTDLRMLHDVYVQLDLKRDGRAQSKWPALSEEKRNPAPKARRPARVLALMPVEEPDDDSEGGAE